MQVLVYMYLHFEVSEMMRHLPRLPIVVMTTPHGAHVGDALLALRTLIEPVTRERERVINTLTHKLMLVHNFIPLLQHLSVAFPVWEEKVTVKCLKSRSIINRLTHMCRRCPHSVVCMDKRDVCKS